jgi:hypothetical protein
VVHPYKRGRYLKDEQPREEAKLKNRGKEERGESTGGIKCRKSFPGMKSKKIPVISHLPLSPSHKSQ